MEVILFSSKSIISDKFDGWMKVSEPPKAFPSLPRPLPACARKGNPHILSQQPLSTCLSRSCSSVSLVLISLMGRKRPFIFCPESKKKPEA